MVQESKIYQIHFAEYNNIKNHRVYKKEARGY